MNIEDRLSALATEHKFQQSLIKGDKMNINVVFKNIEEPELFENIDSFEIKNGKFLFLYADVGNGLEWYLPLENILCFEIDFKEGIKWMMIFK